MITTFFPDISQFSVDSLLFEAYPPKHGCPLPSTWWVVGFQAATLLVKERWLLEQRQLFIMTKPLPRPNNLLTFTKTYLSSSSLMSLGAAHGSKSLFGSFIPTIIIIIIIQNLYIFISSLYSFLSLSLSLSLYIYIYDQLV